LLNDVRFCLRGFARRPLFAAIVVTTLALGLSVNAAIYSIYHQVLLREVPVAAPHELVNLAAPGPKEGTPSCGAIGNCEEVFSYPMFRDLERLTDSPFVGLAAHRDMSANIAIDGQTVAGTGLLVSGGYFSVLGLQAAVGRLLDANDDRVEGEASAAVLSHAYWESAFEADPAVIGRGIVVNGKPLTIVGVAPRGFSGTTFTLRPQVFLPITFSWRDTPNAFPNHANRKSYWVYLFARLKPGVALEQAAAEINVPYRAINNDVDAPLVNDFSEQTMREFRARTVTLEPGARGQAGVDTGGRVPLTLLLVSTGLVLLIASVNIANLFLARGSARVGEIAVRASLGASKRRLLTLLLLEVGLLAAAAAFASLPLTLIALRAIGGLLPAFAVAAFDLSLSAAAVGMTATLAVLSTLVFGLIPALKLLRAESSPALHSQGARATGGRAAARFRTALTTAQIALSMALLVLAGWFAQSLSNVARAELGFRAEALTVFSLAPDRNGYTAERTSQLFERLEEDLAQVPGVTGVALAAVPLIADSMWQYGVTVEGYAPAPGENTDVAVNYVSPDFFRTVEMPLISGSGFVRALTGERQNVAIVNERFVERFGLDPGAALGRRITTGTDGPVDAQIIGIVRDARYSQIKRDIPPQLFLPRTDIPSLGAMVFYLRSSDSSLSLRSSVQEILARHDATLPLMNFRTMADQAKENIFLDRFVGTLAGALAVVATVLAAIGIYGVLSYGVAQRLREIGLRIALGAAPRNVRRMVLKQVAWMAGIGVVLGVSLALLLGQAGRALLYELSPTDPLVPAAAVGSLLAVVLAAAYWPARRAAHVDPVTALRGD
jgi:predicted permease